MIPFSTINLKTFVPTPPEGWVYAGYGPIKHRPNRDEHSFDIALFEHGRWQTSFASIGHGYNVHYAVRSGSEIAIQNGLSPKSPECDLEYWNRILKTTKENILSSARNAKRLDVLIDELEGTDPTLAAKLNEMGKAMMDEVNAELSLM